MSDEIILTPMFEPAPDNVDTLSGGKSILAEVRNQLQTNPQLFYAGEMFSHPSTDPEIRNWTETVDIIVAPVSPIFDAQELNKFMDGLIVGVQTSSRDQADPLEDGGLSLGKLYYDELIGTRRQEITTLVTAVDPEALQRAQIAVGEDQRTVIKNLLRRIWVRVYPNALSAQTIFEYEQGVMNGTVESNSTFDWLKHRIDGGQVRRMKENQR